MKRIFLIDDRHLAWSQIALGLQQVNARINIFTLEDSQKALESGKPELLILGDESCRLLAAASRGVQKLIVSEEIPSGNIVRARGGRNSVRIGWPVGKEAFKELTSRLLSVPERRSFRTPVLIALEKAGVSFRGSSEDFSLAGMSFRTTGSLEPEEKITVSFGSHEQRPGLKLGARVVRRHPAQDRQTTFYGARFDGLTQEERHALERFVWRIRRRGS
jgi:hypothetical protein